jgi:hypothetical protein
MTKKLSFLFFFLAPFFTFSQIGSNILFEPVLSQKFEGVYKSDLDVGDIDGDGDIDLVISGSSSTTGQSETYFYYNEGFGDFIKKEDNSVSGVEDAAVKLWDINTDGSLDLLQSGYISGFATRTRYHQYISNYNFRFATTTPFPNLRYGSISIADIDGDNDDDILLTGYSNTPEAVLYKNSGFGTFTISQSPAFVGVYKSESEFVDLDGDGDQDLLVSGLQFSNVSSTRAYYNNGSGLYQFVNLNLPGIYDGDMSIADVDNDGDQDLFLTGSTGNSTSTTQISQLYLNNGLGLFTPSSSNIVNLKESCSEFFDVDNDGDMDLVISGRISNSLRATRLYVNDGNGNFTHTRSYNGYAEGNLKAFDANADGFLDFVITGFNRLGTSETTLYINNKSGGFKGITEEGFTGLYNPASMMTHVNTDQLLDIVTTGAMGFGRDTNLFYDNTTASPANLTFSQYSTNFPDVSKGSLTPLDVNADGMEDFILTGGQSGSSNLPITRLYLKQASGNYSIVPTPFDDISDSRVDAADIDGDNDLDVILSGYVNGGFATTKLYTNAGNGLFSLSNQNFTSVARGDVQFADIDGDLDQDLFVMGIYNPGTGTKWSSQMYINDGTGAYTAQNNTPFDSLINASAKFDDIDSDGDMDLIMVGGSKLIGGRTIVYTNNGLGVFTEKLNTGLVNVSYANLEVFDVDNDTINDLLITGTTSSGDTTAMYVNDGLGNYTNVIVPFTNVNSGSISVGDLNFDGKKEVFIAGINTNSLTGSRVIARLYRNLSCSYTNFSLSVSGCESYRSTTGDVWTSSGVYLDTVPNSTGCGVILTYDVTINNNAVSNRIDTVCSNYQAPSGRVINTTGVFNDTINTISGCDSVITINLTILESDTSWAISTCSNYAAPSGKIFNSSGIYNDTLPNSIGCDSVITIDLTILSNDTILTLLSCDQYISPTGRVLDSTGIYTDTLTNAISCDSIITIDLTINESTDSLFVLNSCYSYTSPNGHVWDSTGVFRDTISTLTGCDSILIFNLTISDSSSANFNDFACVNYTSPSGLIWTKSGLYTDTIMNTQGCDSIITINLEIQQSDTSFTVNACNSYTTPSGKTINISGVFNDTIANQSLCDSIITIDLNFLETDTIFNVTTCTDYISPSGKLYTSSTAINDTIPNDAGCDSILTINLTIYQPSSTINVSQCNQYISPSGNTYLTSGTYIDTISTLSGCDSIITINLNLDNSSSSSLTISACSSYTTAGGKIVSSSGTYLDTISNNLGCDSVIYYNITINSGSTASILDSVCNDYTLPSGKVVTISGIYSDTIPNSLSCDSVITVDVNITRIDTSISKLESTLTLGTTNVDYVKWYDCVNDSIMDSAVNLSYTVSKNGYYAAIIGLKGCEDTSRCVQITKIGIGERSFENENMFLAYPNPTLDLINVEFKGDIEKQDFIRVYNSLGEIVLIKPLKSKFLTFNLGLFGPGVYVINLQNYSKRVVVVD